MMDLKDIIKWFVPCFHLLLNRKLRKMDANLLFVCLFLFLNVFAVRAAETSDSGVERTSLRDNLNLGSQIQHGDTNSSVGNEIRNLEESSSIGRTFGRPFKKMMAGLLPVIFSMGAASTWAVVATLVGVKTLAVTLFILKILLVAGAAKIGAIFGAKEQHHKPHHQEWTPQKEIHLHIHNGHGNHEVVHDVHHEGYQYSPWNREGVVQPAQQPAESKNVVAFQQYAGPPQFGPQTISTPYGNYVRVDQIQAVKARKRRSSSNVF